jgi:hypothetical protein
MRPANNRKHHNFIHQNIQMMTPGLLKLYAVSRLASSLSQSRFREVIRLKKMRELFGYWLSLEICPQNYIMHPINLKPLKTVSSLIQTTRNNISDKRSQCVSM